MSNSLKIFNDEGRIWALRIVPTGGKYGRGDLLNDKAPMVEFFDCRYEHTNLGQFVNRYYVKTLLDSNAHTKGLFLDCGWPDWSVSPKAMSRIINWLEEQQ